MRNAGLNKAQAGIKIAGRNINNLRYADDITLMAESKEELKRLLMKVKKESEKVGLKLNIQKKKIMASGPITSWQIDGETVERVTDFMFWSSQITTNGDCSHEIKMLAPWKKSYDQPHASKVMLIILQARLQQYVNRELPDVQAGFRKGRKGER